MALLLASRWPALMPAGWLPEPPLLLALGLLSVVIVLHRPFEGASLGLATLVLPSLLVEFGGVPAAWFGGAVLLLADLIRRLLRRYSPDFEERRRRFRSLELAATVSLALVAAAVAARLVSVPSSPGDSSPGIALGFPASIAAAATYGVVLGALLVLDKKIRRPYLPIPWRECLLPLAADLVGWGIGGALAAVTRQLGWWITLPLLTGFALLALESARHALRHGSSQQRIEDLERLSRANRRIAGQETGMSAIAERLCIECLNVIPFQWFQFELLARDNPYRSWFAGPDRILQAGEPQPPASPPALLGVHRRAAWSVLERGLETDEQLIGRLRLWCDPRQLEPSSADLLDNLLPQMVASLQRALLDREAKLDPLTGLAVRRVLEARMVNAFRRASSQGTPMALIMCDLDHFKKINDTYGHAAGDEALIATSRILLARKADNRLSARYGGEEFTILLEDTDGRAALALAEELRREVEALELFVEGEQIFLTQSFGVAAFPELFVQRPEELMELADVALYEAKHQGRNRCLLNLGQGRYLTADGQQVGSGKAAPVEAPRVFA